MYEQFKFINDVIPINSIESITEINDGNINDTFLIITKETDRASTNYILQRINHHVFKKPKAVASNSLLVTQQIQNQSKALQSSIRRTDYPGIVTDSEGKPYLEDQLNTIWRLMTYVPNTQSFLNIESEKTAFEAGFALGSFHRFVAGIDTNKVAVTLKDFHITPHYLQQFDQVNKKRVRFDNSEGEAWCLKFIENRRDFVGVLEDKRNFGLLTVQTIHGDPKISNILFDNDSGQSVCMIDFDTIGTGPVLYDIADCLRSGCNMAGEEAQKIEEVSCDLLILQEILKGYFEANPARLKEGDYTYLFDALRLITFELGLRFFTDHLAGDVYFKTTSKLHNLNRAKVQFTLCEDIESKKNEILAILKDLRKKQE